MNAHSFCLSLTLLATASAFAVKEFPAADHQAYNREMLSHVEKIMILDSIPVGKFEFFRSYRMQPSAGRILSGEEVEGILGSTSLPETFVGTPFTGFTNEFNDYMVWAHEDTTGYLRLAESARLLDGSWSVPEFTPTVLNAGEEVDEEDGIEANAAFPFMLDDGQTLYFASDNPQSMGGYDIFIATKDPGDGEFLIPVNLGLPFNSPFDDYMMALDLQTGVGWWATDRNQLDDKITIYIYALTDTRVNADPDDENIMNIATLANWEELLTPEQQEERKRLLQEISEIQPIVNRTPDFNLPMPKGVVYHYFSDFKNREAASRMQLYLGQKASLEKKEAELAQLRTLFAKGNRGAGSKIATLEKQIRAEKKNIDTLLSEIYRLEIN